MIWRDSQSERALQNIFPLPKAPTKSTISRKLPCLDVLHVELELQIPHLRNTLVLLRKQIKATFPSTATLRWRTKTSAHGSQDPTKHVSHPLPSGPAP